MKSGSRKHVDRPGQYTKAVSQLRGALGEDVGEATGLDVGVAVGGDTGVAVGDGDG